MAADILYRLYEDLLASFGPQHWWPAETSWEVCTGAVLTQNTNWQNVERAIAQLRAAGCLAAEQTLALPEAELAALIRPSGTFRLKAPRLQAVARWWLEHGAEARQPESDLGAVRRRLLTVHGVGPETADSILLYACQRPVFVVDAYTRRFLSRHGLLEEGASYGDIQRRFMEHPPSDAVSYYQEYHALIVALGKAYCKPAPRCLTCPLRWHLPEPPAAP